MATTSSFDAMSNDAAELVSFGDAFDSTCSQLYVQHAQMNVAMEERLGRLAIWDAEVDARYELRVSAHEAFGVALNMWKNDAAKLAYTQRLMEAYYGKVVSGSAKQAEIDTRRARLTSQETF